MQSTSTLTISWRQPDIQEEQWEFFHHPAKQEYYQRHGVSWEGLLTASAVGRLVPYPRAAQLNGLPVRLAYAAYDEYARYLAKAKRGYRLNYNRMEEALQRSGNLCLPAPIVLTGGGEALLFAGYRRLCLAWNYGMVPHVWLVRHESRPEDLHEP
jgi:hypothetical protein